jgi:hypothetical protein
MTSLHSSDVSADGTTYTVARVSSSEEAASRLERLMNEFPLVTDLVLGHIVLDDAAVTILLELLKQRSWKSWKFIDCLHLVGSTRSSSQEYCSSISEAMTMQRLVLQTTPAFEAGKINFMPLALLLSKNQALTSLRLCDHVCSELTASGLAVGLQHTSKLEELSLSGSRRCGAQIETLCRGLERNTSLKELHVGDCQLGDANIAELVTSLRNHPTLLTLNLSNNGCRNGGLQAIASLLEENGVLQALDLSLQRRRLDLSILSPALANNNNSVLKRLNLANTNLHDSDIQSLADALVQNLTLRDLNLSANMQVTVDGLVYFAERLPEMKIQYLNLLKVGLTQSDPRAFAALSEGMEHNTHILLLRIHYWRHVQYTRSIQFFVNANRGGRCLLKVQAEIPRGLWPLVFARAFRHFYFCPLPQPQAPMDNIYYMLRNAPVLWE